MQALFGKIMVLGLGGPCDMVTSACVVGTVADPGNDTPPMPPFALSSLWGTGWVTGGRYFLRGVRSGVSVVRCVVLVEVTLDSNTAAREDNHANFFTN